MWYQANFQTCLVSLIQVCRITCSYSHHPKSYQTIQKYFNDFIPWIWKHFELYYAVITLTTKVSIWMLFLHLSCLGLKVNKFLIYSASNQQAFNHCYKLYYIDPHCHLQYTYRMVYFSPDSSTVNCQCSCLCSNHIVHIVHWQ